MDFYNLPPEVVKEIGQLRADKKDWDQLEDDQKLALKIAVDEMLWRNEAIFMMLFFQLHGTVRTRYARECDRIINSDFFRHLQYKSQVMFNNASDDQRTRLIHTLEVAGVAKTLAKQLGCNWELAEAMALGHDLGHVPFGHQGEEALDKCLNKAWAGRFAHSLQSARVLGHLANHTTIYDQFGVSGLCLSRPVMEGILKHDTDNLLHDIRRASWRLQYNGWREALPLEQEKDESKEREEWKKGLAIGGLETQIVYWADKIAYAGHDWDEFAKSGLIEQMTLDIEYILKRMHQLRHMAHGDGGVRTADLEKKESDDRLKDIASEVDLICLIRYHIEEIRKTLTDKTKDESDKTKDKSDEQLIIAAFKPSYQVVGYDGKIRNKDINSKNESPLACFVYEFMRCINDPDKNIKFKYFTKENYKLLLDYFRVAHDLIYLMGIYPKPYKKNDDVVRVIFRYLTETDDRRLVQALQPKLLQSSRKRINDNIAEWHLKGEIFTEEHVIRIGRNAVFSEPCSGYPLLPGFDTLPGIVFNEETGKTEIMLDVARKGFGKLGYSENADASFEKQTREFKTWFRESLQKQMIIRMEDNVISAHNRIGDFVRDYYIGSERVRIMKHKAHKIIEKLFEFYMNHEDMLPIEYQHRIAFDAQKLSQLKDEFFEIDGKPSGEERLLVIQYLIERIEENIERRKPKGAKEEEILKEFHKHSYDSVPINTLKYVIKTCNNPAIEKPYLSIETEISNKPNSNQQFFKLCEHIAKARIVADYISTMTDRYAEKKYNEIESSNTSWSVSFHE